MLQKAMHDLKGDDIVATDGSIGSVRDVLFDDARWGVRYLVVDTGGWLSGRKVLISPASVDPSYEDPDAIHVRLTRDQVEHAPGIDEDPPISRLLEDAHAQYYGYPSYWTGPYLWGSVAVPFPVPPPDPPPGTAQGVDDERRRAAEERARESHVRSADEVVGYAIEATDGEIGHVEDFLVDDRTWGIAQMVVDTRNWLPGRKVLVPPDAIADVDWDGRKVRVRLSREEIRQSPDSP